LKTTNNGKENCNKQLADTDSCVPFQKSSFDASLVAAMAIDRSFSQTTDITMEILDTSSNTDPEITETVNNDITLNGCEIETSKENARSKEARSVSVNCSSEVNSKRTSNNDINVKVCNALGQGKHLDTAIDKRDNKDIMDHSLNSSSHGNLDHTITQSNTVRSSTRWSPTPANKDVQSLCYKQDKYILNFPLHNTPVVDIQSKVMASEKSLFLKNSDLEDPSQNVNSESAIDNNSPSYTVQVNRNITCKLDSAEDDKENDSSKFIRNRKTTLSVEKNQPSKKFRTEKTSERFQGLGKLKERVKNKSCSSRSRRETEDLMNAIYSSAVVNVWSRTSSTSSVHGDTINSSGVLDSPKNFLKLALSVNRSSSFQFGKTNTSPNSPDFETDDKDILLLQDDDMNDNVFDEDLMKNENDNATDQEESLYVGSEEFEKSKMSSFVILEFELYINAFENVM